jgi:hypothetical protein
MSWARLRLEYAEDGHGDVQQLVRKLKSNLKTMAVLDRMSEVHNRTYSFVVVLYDLIHSTLDLEIVFELFLGEVLGQHIRLDSNLS